MTAQLTTLVVPSLGRPSLAALLEALAQGTRPVDGPVLVVDDRPGRSTEPLVRPGTATVPGLTVLRSGGRGPAAARNVGWRHARTPWVSFLDDDVVPGRGWSAALVDDLAAADRPGADGRPAAGSQGRLHVPLPAGRRPTDWERSTAGLATARWITADMSYRREALASVGGFDERFRRAYREDADLALRVTRAHGEVRPGTRLVEHPVRPADDWQSVRQQAGNADDFLMRALHGPRWRQLVGAPRGRRRRHLAVTGAAAVAIGATLTGRRRTAGVGALLWATGTLELLAARVAPGPRDREEVRRMAVTSVVLPLAATWHAARGLARHRAATPWQGAPELVLFDRDDTLVVDVPYNGDPDLVRPVPGARAALDRLREAGIRVGVVTNQSGIRRGLLSEEQVAAVNRRTEELLGRFDVWQICPHAPEDGCPCRKPEPGLVEAACDALGVPVDRCLVIGDIGSDVDAATAAGARSVLVPTSRTRAEEVRRARVRRRDLASAVDLALVGAW